MSKILSVKNIFCQNIFVKMFFDKNILSKIFLTENISDWQYFDKTSNRVLALKHSELRSFDLGFGFLVKFHLGWYFFRPVTPKIHRFSIHLKIFDVIIINIIIIVIVIPLAYILLLAYIILLAYAILLSYAMLLAYAILLAYAVENFRKSPSATLF